MEKLRWNQQLASLGKDEQQRAKNAAQEKQKRDRAIVRVLTRIRNRELIITFDAWLEYTTEVVRVKRLLKRAAAKMAMRGLATSFEGWYLSVQERRKNRFKVKRCLMRIQKRTLVVALNTWTNTVENAKRNKTVLHTV